MYDYINITDSKESTTIVFAYGKPKGNIRMETFVHEKPYNAFVRTQNVNLWHERSIGDYRKRILLQAGFRGRRNHKCSP